MKTRFSLTRCTTALRWPTYSTDKKKNTHKILISNRQKIRSFYFFVLFCMNLLSTTYYCYDIFCRGDPAIVYLDGVTPPTTSMVRTNTVPRSQVTKTLSYPLTKANGNHHQQLLQTIREDDCESR